MAKGSIEWETGPEEGLVLRIKPGMRDIKASAEVMQHALAARKEMLLTIRSLLDLAIGDMDAKTAASPHPGTKIDIE